MVALPRSRGESLIAVLPLLALAFAAGIALADAVAGGGAVALAAGVGSAVLTALFMRDARAFAAIALVVSFAAGFVALRAQTQLSERFGLRTDVKLSVAASVCEVRASQQRVEVVLCRSRSIDSDTRIPARIRVVERRDAVAIAWWSRLEVGDSIRAALQLRPLRAAGNPGQRSRDARDRRRGIGAIAHGVDPLLCVRIAGTSGTTSDDASRLQLLRRQTHLRLASSGEGGALLSALAVGDRSALGDGPRENFRRLGISHLLAVSGLHLGLVAGGAYLALLALAVRMTRLSSRFDLRIPALLGACALAGLYALFTGFGVPVQRALVFLLAAAAARLFGRALRPQQLLAAGALAVLTAEPAALFEVGPQLSFAASAALLWAWMDWPEIAGASFSRRVSERAGLLLQSSAIAVAATAPILVLHGLPLASAALWANAIAVPLTSLLLLPLALLAAAATWLPDSIGLPSLAAADAIARFSLALAERGAAWAPSVSPRPAPHPAIIALCVALGLLVIRLRGSVRRLALAFVLVAILHRAPVPPLPPSAPRIVALDVGLGDALWIEGRRGSLLVDAALALPDAMDLGRSVVVPALEALSVRRIDIAVASHADADHRGGLPAVLQAFDVGELWLPAGTRGDPDFAPLLSVAAARGVRVVERGQGDAAAQVGDLEIETLWPPRDRLRRSRNDASLVLRVQVAGRRLLLTGDIGERVEAQLLRDPERLKADVLKVAHHGSRGASSEAFLSAVAADVALISAPCSARAAHPAAAALTRLRGAGAALWWTGRGGAAFVALDSPRARLVAWSWLHEPRAACDRRSR